MTTSYRPVIVPYKETWPAEFEDIASGIREATGDWAQRIDHIGSTSVPGLAAKDRIDIQVGVPVLDIPSRTIQAMERLGYAYRDHIMCDHQPPGDNHPVELWTKRLFSSDDSTRAANIHVRVIGWPNWRYALLFRDYLREHPESAGAYAVFKRQLASVPMITMDHYPDLKDPVCDLIMAAAEAWAASTGWKPQDAGATA